MTKKAKIVLAGMEEGIRVDSRTWRSESRKPSLTVIGL